MEIKEYNSDIVKSILIGCITDNSILASVSAQWDTHSHQGLFREQFANTLFRWCHRYFVKHGQAPQTSIRLAFEEYKREALDREVVQSVENFLISLDTESESLRIDTNYVIDLASRYFTEVRLERVSSGIQTKLQQGKWEDCVADIESFSQIDLRADTGIDPLRDTNVIQAAFADANERLIGFQNEDADIFFGDTFSRDALVGFIASEKQGKSMVLLDMVCRGLKEHRKVAYFEVGDMSRNQVMLRLMQRFCKHPRRPCIIKQPKSISFTQSKGTVINYTVYAFRQGLTADLALERCKRLADKFGEDYLRLSVHPNGTMSVSLIETVLDGWKNMGWIPDIVVVDYADLLTASDGRADKRHQVDDTWKRLRGLSQARHCLVLTATQSDSAGYSSRVLTRSNFSESKTINAHVTALIGINADSREREMQLRRLNYIVRRESAYNEYECLYTAGCLAICSPMQVFKLRRY